MNIKIALLVSLLLFTLFSCAYPPGNDIPKGTEKVVLDSLDTSYGYYLKVPPATEEIKGVLVLLPGFGQVAEMVLLDTELPEIARKKGLLTICFSGLFRFSADSVIQEKLNAVLVDVMAGNVVDKNNVFVGGFSAGGVIALRYVELCHQYPNRFPVQPRAVFMADAPVDIFHLWALKEEDIKQNRSKIATDEAGLLADSFREYYGATPSENPEIFRELSPFAIDTALGTNEQSLKNVAVRAYHDVDIAWRINNRNQTARFENYIATSELINRLRIMGNERAEFVQSYQTGYRNNGNRHPHSWSIIDAEECTDWLLTLIAEDGD